MAADHKVELHLSSIVCSGEAAESEEASGFTLAPAASASGGPDALPCCALAKMSPKPRPTGNMVKDMAAKHDHALSVDCINILHAHPSLRSDCRGFLFEAMAQKANDDLGTDDYFSDVCTLGKLDEDWTVMWVCKTTGFSPSDLGKANLEDKDVLQHILDFLLVATRTLKLPEDCRLKAVAGRVLDARAAQAGNGEVMLKGHAILKNGQINYLLFVYKMEFDQTGKATAVIHKPTNDRASIPADVAITEYFELVSKTTVICWHVFSMDPYQACTYDAPQSILNSGMNTTT